MFHSLHAGIGFHESADFFFSTIDVFKKSFRYNYQGVQQFAPRSGLTFR